MKIKDLLKVESIALGMTAADQNAVIDKLIALHETAGNLKDSAAFKEAILKREAESTTALGEGLAVPHAKTDAVKKAGLAAATVPDGVDYKAPDGKPSNLFFMIAAPEEGGDVHLEILSRLMVMLMDADFTEKLRKAKTPEEFLDIINAQEALKYPEEQEAESKDAPAAAEVPAAAEPKGYQFLGVTACPTGIAHTYMAAEALEKAGAEMGYSIKVETDGQGGVKNLLTKAEIAACDGIIIAADKNVEMARFDGKPVLEVHAADGINKPKELIQKMLDGKAPIYHATGGAEVEDTVETEKESIGRKIYKDLMNGVSHMLPFVVGGGILVAIAFLIDTIYCMKTGLPYGSDFGSMLAGSAWIKSMGGAAMGFMLPVLSGFIAMSIADRPGLLVGFAGGYLAKIGATWTDPNGDAGISAGFIGALIAGFAAGYLVKGLKKLCSHMPDSLEGIKPMLIYPVLGLAGICVIMCTLDPAFIWLNGVISHFLTWLGSTNYLVLLGLVLGGMMAIDMGGPINKAAYLFGTGLLTEAAASTDPAFQTMCYQCMAAVMIGGMVPPLALAVACQLFPKKFSKAERQSAPTNYVMGLSFITEGAIPFAAADPARVIPSLVIGSAVAGALSMAFGCTLLAPHGGIFVFATVGKWYFYLLALAIGVAASVVALRFLKKDQVTEEPVEAK